MEINKTNAVQGVSGKQESVPAVEASPVQNAPARVSTPAASDRTGPPPEQESGAGNSDVAPPKKRYFTAYDFKTAPGLNDDILKLNDELRDIERQSFNYQNDINELKKEIENSGSSDPEKTESDTAEMGALKSELSEAEAERTRKINEIRAMYAEGTYSVSGREIVDNWD
jgi:hypothetical protein